MSVGILTGCLILVILGFRKILRGFNESAIADLTRFAIEADRKVEVRRRHIATVYAAVRKSYEIALRNNQNPDEDIRSALSLLKTPEERKRFVEHARIQGNSALTTEILLKLRWKFCTHNQHTNE